MREGKHGGKLKSGNTVGTGRPKKLDSSLIIKRNGVEIKTT